MKKCEGVKVGPRRGSARFSAVEAGEDTPIEAVPPVHSVHNVHNESRQAPGPARKHVLVIVAHPDDETLWAGGTLLMNAAQWRTTIITMCRADDAERAERFERVVKRYHAEGYMGDMDDRPEQTSLAPAIVEATAEWLLVGRRFDLVLTHGPRGEYTRHRRHEETCAAVVALWRRGALETPELWMFAYEDGGRSYPPRADERAHAKSALPADVFREKYELITHLYGFAPESWEAQATPREEAFWRFTSPEDAQRWIEEEEPSDEGADAV